MINKNGFDFKLLETSYMYEIIKNYCENEAKNGLLLVDMPTGSKN